MPDPSDAQSVLAHAAEALAEYLSDETLTPVHTPIQIAAAAQKVAQHTVDSLRRDGHPVPLGLDSASTTVMTAAGVSEVIVRDNVTVIACAALTAIAGPEGWRQAMREAVGLAQHLLIQEAHERGATEPPDEFT